MVRFLQECNRLLRSLPERLATGMDEWVLYRHSPIQIELPEPLTSVAVCRCCEAPWPCAESIRALHRLSKTGGAGVETVRGQRKGDSGGP
jgi:hypothetical protein